MNSAQDNKNTAHQEEIVESEPIDKLSRGFKVLLHNEALAGLTLLGATVVALVWANSSWGESYEHLWHIPLELALGDWRLSYSLQHWINDLLMAMFFFLVGLEIKREIIAGELSTLSKALLPVSAAIGGMIVPALIYAWFNPEGSFQRGWGIPMATDIAFAIGILSLFGRKVPIGLKVFLAALAIADDIGAVLVIAIFYSENLEIMKLVWGMGFLGILLIFNLVGVRSALLYGVVGVGGLWLSFLLSGLHPSVAGVLAAFTIPATRKLNARAFLLFLQPYLDRLEDEFEDNRPAQRSPFLDQEQMKAVQTLEVAYKAATPPLQRLEAELHPWIYFCVMPIFALANAGVPINAAAIGELSSPLSLGIIVGLILGKCIGIFSCTLLVVRLGLSQLPTGVNWKMVFGVSCLGGIGFTMSLFISALAFKGDAHSLEAAKLSILVGSLGAGIIGSTILAYSGMKGEVKMEEEI